MQVRAANAGRSHFDDGIVWVLDFGLLDLLHGHAEGAVVVQGFHFGRHGGGR